MTLGNSLILALLAGLLIRECDGNQVLSKAERDQPPTISAEALWTRISSGEDTFILDVRTPEEFDGPLGHIDSALLIPVQELPGRLEELSSAADRQVFVICRSGNRSARATRILLQAGFRAVNVAGGMRAWDDLKRNDPLQ